WARPRTLPGGDQRAPAAQTLFRRTLLVPEERPGAAVAIPVRPRDPGGNQKREAEQAYRDEEPDRALLRLGRGGSHPRRELVEHRAAIRAASARGQAPGRRRRLPVVDEPVAVPCGTDLVEADHEDLCLLMRGLGREERHREPDPFFVRKLQPPFRRGDREGRNPGQVRRVPLLARIAR